MTFIVNDDGVVYQKDLGKKSDVLARAIENTTPIPVGERPKTWQALHLLNLLNELPMPRESIGCLNDYWLDFRPSLK